VLSKNYYMPPPGISVSGFALRIIQPTSPTTSRSSQSDIRLVVPAGLVQLLKLDLPIMKEAGGALAHAQMLARPTDRHGTIDINRIGSMRDLAETVSGVRGRVWAIRLNGEQRDIFYQDILSRLAAIHDPVGRAAAIVDIFPGVPATNRGTTNSLLATLPVAADRLIRAMTWPAYIDKRPGKNNPVSFYNIMREFFPVITEERLVQFYHLDARAVRLATKVNRGFDLIALASALIWVGEVVKLGVKRDFHLAGIGAHELTIVVDGLRAMVDGRTYGFTEVTDTSLDAYHRECLSAAIDRLTAYRKRLNKRVESEG